MDNPHLNSILLNLQDHLSDNDRERLDNYLKYDVTRSIGFDSTFIGNLKLIQSYFDQDNIKDNDFTLLINAFQQIQCFDAVYLLHEHQHQILSLSSIMPSHTQEFRYNSEDEHQDVTEHLLSNEINHNNNNDGQRRASPRKLRFCIHLFPLILILLVILILIFNPKNTRTIIWEKNHQINQNCTPSSQNQSITLIKAGRKFGRNEGDDFDNSLLQNFSTFYYLSGFIIFDTGNFDSCQFIYRSSQPNQTRIKSDVYGSYVGRRNRTRKYYLDQDERIVKVQISMKINTGWKFITTKGRSIPPNFNLTGNNIQSESFPGYTLGYVTGKSSSKIDQLQFFWYRTQ